MSKKIYNVGIVPGSFDPITNGHINIIRRACELCEVVYVAIMINDQKKYMFSLEERTDIAREVLSGYDGVRVISSDGMLWELAEKLSADAIIKGVRNDKDRAYELDMARYNAEHAPRAKTLLLESEEGFSNISSTLVRELLKDGREPTEFLPIAALNEIKKILNKRRI